MLRRACFALIALGWMTLPVGLLAQGTPGVPEIIPLPGPYQPAPGDLLRLDIGGFIPGVEHDQAQVSGSANLGGQLQLDLIDLGGGYNPDLGDQQVLLTANLISGRFDSVFLPDPLGINSDALAIDLRLFAPDEYGVVWVAPDGSNQFVSSLAVSDWNDENIWSSLEVPDTPNVVALNNLAGGFDQEVQIGSFLQGPQNGYAHDLSIEGIGSKRMTLRILPGGSFSAVHRATISREGDVIVEEGASFVSRHIDVASGGRLDLNQGRIVTSNNTVSVSGELTGEGLVSGRVEVTPTGVVAPGTGADATATLIIDGDYDHIGGGTLEIDLEGMATDAIDRLEITGDVELTGDLKVDASALSSAAIGDSFEILTAISSSLASEDRFSSVAAVGVAPGFYLAPKYSASTVSVAFALPGDMNADFTVDADDIDFFALALRDRSAYFNYDDGSGPLGIDGDVSGDLDFDGSLDFDDIDDFVAMVPGTTVAGVLELAFGSPVPEPSSFLLFLAAALGFVVPRPCRVTSLPSPRRARPRHGFTLIELLVVVAIIGLLTALLLPAIQAARESARRSSCQNRLKQVGLALQGHHSQNRVFPAGTRLYDEDNSPRRSLSWRVYLLPFLEERSLYDQIEPLPGGGSNNWAPQATIVNVFLCPSRPPEFEHPQSLKRADYHAIAGAARGDEHWTLETGVIPQRCGDVYPNGVLFPESQVSIAKITDGSSHTLMVGERTYIHSWQEHWMLGATWTRDASATPPYEKICMGGAKNIAYPINADRETFGYFTSDLEVSDPSKKILPLNDLDFGSDHPGGAQFVLADGSVRFLEETIDFTLYQNLATRDGGELIGQRSDAPTGSGDRGSGSSVK